MEKKQARGRKCGAGPSTLALFAIRAKEEAYSSKMAALPQADAEQSELLPVWGGGGISVGEHQALGYRGGLFSRAGFRRVPEGS